MPWSPRSACSAPGCPHVSEPHRARCAAHERIAFRVPSSRPSPGERGYDLAWAKARAEALKRNPFCSCGEKAQLVDHVLPIRAGGTHDQSNLQPLCRRCHDVKTSADRRIYAEYR